MTVSETHKEIHSKLMQRKNPNVLWGSPFDNAWVGLILCNHRSKDEITLREIVEYLNRWTHSSTFLREERNVGSASLYIAILTAMRDKIKIPEIQKAIRERLLELNKKEKGKFSLFNSPEIFYSTVIGMVLSGATRSDKELKDMLSKYVKQEIENSWSNKVYRFALYSATALELNLDSYSSDKIIKYLSSISVKELNIDEVIPLLWFMTKYSENLDTIVRRRRSLRRLIEEKRAKLWEQFQNQRMYFSFDIEISGEEAEFETSSGYTLSTFELAMIDDTLACAEKVYKVDPNEVYELLELHPIVRKASEQLFKDGYYAQAVFETYKAVNNYVKRKSRKRQLDGKDLMSKVFSFDYNRQTDQITRKPLLQLNKLRNQSDRDEQEGFMHLFMGSMQGIRNPKAHDEIVQKDPFRTLEYLAFASLLAKRVDEAKRTRQR